MIFSAQNILTTDPTDVIFLEQCKCSKCSSRDYSSVVLRKEGTSTQRSYIVSSKSYEFESLPSSLLYCKCDCGNSWLEFLNPSHHRPHIDGVFMRSYSGYLHPKERSKKYIILKAIPKPGLLSYPAFITNNNPQEPEFEKRCLSSGEMAYDILGYADTMLEAQVMIGVPEHCRTTNKEK